MTDSAKVPHNEMLCDESMSFVRDMFEQLGCNKPFIDDSCNAVLAKFKALHPAQPVGQTMTNVTYTDGEPSREWVEEKPQPTAEVAEAVEYAEGIADEHEVKAKRMAAEGYEQQYLDCRLDQAKHLRTLIAAAKENQSLERQIKMASDWIVKQSRSLVEYAEEVSALKQAAQSPQRSAELVRALKEIKKICWDCITKPDKQALPKVAQITLEALSAFGEGV